VTAGESHCVSLTLRIPEYFLIVAVHFGQTEMCKKKWLSAGLGPPPLHQNPPGEVVFERDWALREPGPRSAPMQVIARAPHSAVMFPRVAEKCFRKP
jgi:hypothetical protein